MGLSLAPGVPTSNAMPRSPNPRPAILSADSRSPLIRKCARKAVQTGADAPKTATRPLGTNCSAQKMIAQLPPVLMIPTTATTASSRRPRGNGWRSESATSVRITATATARSNAKMNGGTSATPILIAAHVDPQISATAA